MAQAKEVRGPGPRMGGPRPKVENPGKLLKRIMDEVFRNYLPHCILVLVCIVVSALANVQASLFLQTLMDDYIVPMTRQQNPSFAPLAGALVRMCCIYLVGILAAWANARIMVNVTQGTLRNLRTKLFTHMESLPIRYFDTHPHGDIMSVYTNDVDTLRQMLSQSIPQLVSSVITIVSVFFSMCMLSWQLTIVTMLMVALMLFCCSCIPSLFSCRRSSSLAAASRREMTSLFSLERILRRISSWSRCASASLISRCSSSISLLPLCAPAVICSISSRMASLSFFSCSCRSRKAARAASLPLCWPSICSMAIWTPS